MKKKIALISDSRCSHGLYIPILDALTESSDFQYQYIITGMHLLEKFGRTIEEIKKSGYRITHAFPVLMEGNDQEDQVKNIAEFIRQLANIFLNDRPDFILAQGDRGITLAAAIVGNHLRIPIVHMYGGEVSRTVDEPVRHAITRLAHIHIAGSKKSAERLRKMGEEDFRVHAVGATGVEYIKKLQIKKDNTVLRKYHLPVDNQFVVVLQHPVSGEEKHAGIQMGIILSAVVSTQLKILVIYPNSDPGHEEMIKMINEYVKKYPNMFLAQRNIPYLNYLSILKAAGTLVGNSSGGIIETPSLGTPTINVGTRQLGREKALNVIDVDYNEPEIKRALELTLYNLEFKRRVAQGKTPYDPYGDGNASGRILRIMRETKINNRLLTKRLSY